MPDRIGGNTQGDIGNNIDHISSDSIAHYLHDSMIEDMSDILQDAKLICSIDYLSKATSQSLLVEAV
jgi:hypothetical protein